MLQIILHHIFSDELEEADGTQTVVPRHELMNIVSVTQLEKDTILVCHDNMVKVRVVYTLLWFCSLLTCICRSSTYKGSWSPPSVKPVNSISISPFPVLFALRTGDASFTMTKLIVCVFSKWLIKFGLLGLTDDVPFFCSVLAFHRQGMQGRSFKNNEVNSTTTIDNTFSRQILCSINL